MKRTGTTATAAPGGSAEASLAARLVWHAWAPLAPLVAGFLVLVVGCAFGAVIGFRSVRTAEALFDLDRLFPELPVPLAATGADSEAAGGREPGSSSTAGRFDEISRQQRASVAWGISAVALSLVLVVSLGVAWCTIYDALASRGAARTRWMAPLLVAVAGVGVIVWWRETPILPHVLQVLVDALSPRVKVVREITKGLAVAAILSLAIAISATLVGNERSAPDLAVQTRRLRVLLYFVGALLAAGVLEVAFLLHWPASRLLPHDAEPIRALAESVTSAAGALLSLLIVATYGTGAWILYARAATLAPPAGVEGRKEWFAGQGLETSPGQQILRVFAVLAPLVAGGPLASILETLT